MKEKILIQSKSATKIIPLLLIVVGIILFVITYITHWSWDDLATVMYFVSPAITIWGAFLYIVWSKSSITVTDKRVYGKAYFGKRVDLPLDSVSAVGISIMQGIDVGTSSGRIKFKFVKNYDEIHSVLSKLLIERQQEKSNNSSHQNNVTPTSNADELKKFKELLDSGVITQEEFDEKKKQLLGL